MKRNDLYQLIGKHIQIFFHWNDLFPEGSGPNNEGSWGANRGSTGLKLSDCHLFINIPRPSIIPSKIPPTTALVAIAPGPCLADITAPAPAPDKIEFQGSSFCLKLTREHSKLEKQRHQAANCPPSKGPLSRIRTRPPMALLLNPAGAPPTQPMVNAPPQSLTIRQGHGSLLY